MFGPSETANDLFRRLHNSNQSQFNLRITPNRYEQLSFSSIIEVLSSLEELPQFVLGTAMEFALQVEEGMVVHVSTGNNMFNSILQSHIDISSTALFKMHTNQRVKSIVVQSLLQLLSAIEVLKLSLQHQQTLVILEGLSPLFFVSRTRSRVLGDESMVSIVLKNLQLLSHTHNIIVIWVNTLLASKVGIGLRDGFFSRDSMSLLWKQYVPKHYIYQELM